MSTQREHDRRRAIHERAEAATTGPWHGPHDESDLCARFGDFGWTAGSPDGNGPAYDVDSEQGKADAEFIAHSRVDVPWLLDLVDGKDIALEVAGWELAAAQMERDGANVEVEKQRAAIQRVRAEHEETDGTCSSCIGWDDKPQPWPCATITALDGEVPDGN